MIVRNKIWDEIVHADANRICTRKYANAQRRIQLIYKVGVPLLSGICAVAVEYDKLRAAFWTALILCISTIFKAVFPQIILPEKEIAALDKLHEVFLVYRDKVEGLLHRFDKKEINEEEAFIELDSLQKANSKKKSELNKLVLWIPRFIDNSITKESEQYLNAIYNNKYER